MPRKKIQKWLTRRRVGISVILVLFAVLGIAVLGIIRAATPSLDVEPEQGTLSAGAVTVNDSAASGGQAVRFAAPVNGGKAYYVDCSGGSDSNSGTSQTSAWSTLTKASAASLASGEQLLFKRGCSWSGTLTIGSSGATISNYGSGALPIFTNATDASNHIVVNGDNNTIDGVSVQGSNHSCATCTGAGINLNNGATGNTIKNSIVSGKWAGIYLRDGANNNKITFNTIKDNRMLSDRGGPDDDSGAFGILVHGASNDISYNNFSGQNVNSPDYGLDGSSVEIYTLSGKTPASNNRIHHNKSVNDNAFSELGKDSSASSPSGNIYAYNTYVSSGISNAIFVNTRGNTNFGPVNNTIVYNNSVYITGSSKAALVCSSCTSSIMTGRNNVLITSASPISGSGGAFSNNVTTSPYVSAPNDLHLRAGTSAIDGATNDAVAAGFTVDLDGIKVPTGSAPDIGAYEFH